MTPALTRSDRRLLKRLGYGRVPSTFVPDPPAADPRPAGEVLERMLALHVVVSVATGAAPASAAPRLLDGWDVHRALDGGEAEYLADAADGVRVEDAARALAVEQVVLLAWAIGVVDDLPIDEPAAGLPDLGDVPAEPVLRDVDELRRVHALHAAMVWALRADPDLAVGAAPGAVDPYVVHHRAEALRWLFSSAARGRGRA